MALGPKIYVVSERGVFQAIDTAIAEGKVTQEIELLSGSKDMVLCTPAIAEGAVYARSDGKLWKLN
ncbi:MAG: Pyrrolo-quinoline quinone [Verrucomicrobiaceae bacterium]|nr:Pyrrolo-quinoline quinone [Verrucomicrobiaceae bacterium]